MSKRIGLLVSCGLLAFTALAEGDAYSVAIDTFRGQPATAPYFREAYGYAVFPTVGKGGIGVGGAYGNGRAYRQGKYVADVRMAQLSVGWQLGGQAFSEIIFFRDADTFAEFSGGSFQFGAEASAVALTAGAQASATTKGATASAGMTAESTRDSAATWYRGMAVFTVAKGGLMYEAAITGQAFDYRPLGASE